MPSAAGATKARKSDGVIHDGTASTPIMMPSESCTAPRASTGEARGGDGALDEDAAGAASEGLMTSRYRCTTPSGRFVDPDFDRSWDLGTKVAVAGPRDQLSHHCALMGTCAQL